MADGPEGEIEALKRKLSFARAATARQKKRLQYARWLIRHVRNLLADGDVDRAVFMLDQRDAEGR